MNLVFIYLGEECLVISYSASCVTMCLLDVIYRPAWYCKDTDNQGLSVLDILVILILESAFIIHMYLIFTSKCSECLKKLHTTPFFFNIILKYTESLCIVDKSIADSP